MENIQNVILQTDAAGFPVKRGKVRDIYDLGDKLLLVASDRISAFDVIMPNGIPCKGIILTQISKFWFDMFAKKFPNHVISTDVKEFPEPFKSRPEMFAGRSMLVRKLKVVAIECVVRGYITGSGWKDYQKSGCVCGIELPKGLKQCDKLPEPIFTPGWAGPGQAASG
jgi:phosphoribosylaminoimidazole-succinocarboxamide synthase